MDIILVKLYVCCYCVLLMFLNSTIKFYHQSMYTLVLYFKATNKMVSLYSFLLAMIGLPPFGTFCIKFNLFFIIFTQNSIFYSAFIFFLNFILLALYGRVLYIKVTIKSIPKSFYLYDNEFFNEDFYIFLFLIFIFIFYPLIIIVVANWKYDYVQILHKDFY